MHRQFSPRTGTHSFHKKAAAGLLPCGSFLFPVVCVTTPQEKNEEALRFLIQRISSLSAHTSRSALRQQLQPCKDSFSRYSCFPYSARTAPVCRLKVVLNGQARFALPFVQIARRDNGLLRQQEVFAAAPCPVNAMGGNAFHSIAGKAERVVRLTVAEFQQL